MKPTNDPDDALVDLVDAILRDGVVLEADAVITVADVPLVGLKLRAALAGMTTMTQYGMLLDMDERARRRIGDVDPGERPTERRPRAEGTRRRRRAAAEGRDADDRSPSRRRTDDADASSPK